MAGSEDFKVLVQAELNPASINSFRADLIKALQKNPIPIEFDIKDNELMLKAKKASKKSAKAASGEEIKFDANTSQIMADIKDDVAAIRSLFDSKNFALKVDTSDIKKSKKEVMQLFHDVSKIESGDKLLKLDIRIEDWDGKFNKVDTDVKTLRSFTNDPIDIKVNLDTSNFDSQFEDLQNKLNNGLTINAGNINLNAQGIQAFGNIIENVSESSDGAAASIHDIGNAADGLGGDVSGVNKLAGALSEVKEEAEGASAATAQAAKEQRAIARQATRNSRQAHRVESVETSKGVVEGIIPAYMRRTGGQVHIGSDTIKMATPTMDKATKEALMIVNDAAQRGRRLSLGDIQSRIPTELLYYIAHASDDPRDVRRWNVGDVQDFSLGKLISPEDFLRGYEMMKSGTTLEYLHKLQKKAENSPEAQEAYNKLRAKAEGDDGFHTLRGDLTSFQEDGKTLFRWDGAEGTKPFYTSVIEIEDDRTNAQRLAGKAKEQAKLDAAKEAATKKRKEVAKKISKRYGVTADQLLNMSEGELEALDAEFKKGYKGKGHFKKASKYKDDLVSAIAAEDKAKQEYMAHTIDDVGTAQAVETDRLYAANNADRRVRERVMNNMAGATRAQRTNSAAEGFQQQWADQWLPATSEEYYDREIGYTNDEIAQRNKRIQQMEAILENGVHQNGLNVPGFDEAVDALGRGEVPIVEGGGVARRSEEATNEYFTDLQSAINREKEVVRKLKARRDSLETRKVQQLEILDNGGWQFKPHTSGYAEAADVAAIAPERIAGARDILSKYGDVLQSKYGISVDELASLTPQEYRDFKSKFSGTDLEILNKIRGASNTIKETENAVSRANEFGSVEPAVVTPPSVSGFDRIREQIGQIEPNTSDIDASIAENERRIAENKELLEWSDKSRKERRASGDGTKKRKLKPEERDALLEENSRLEEENSRLTERRERIREEVQRRKDSSLAAVDRAESDWQESERRVSESGKPQQSKAEKKSKKNIEKGLYRLETFFEGYDPNSSATLKDHATRRLEQTEADMNDAADAGKKQTSSAVVDEHADEVRRIANLDYYDNEDYRITSEREQMLGLVDDELDENARRVARASAFIDKFAPAFDASHEAEDEIARLEPQIDKAMQDVENARGALSAYEGKREEIDAARHEIEESRKMALAGEIGQDRVDAAVRDFEKRYGIAPDTYERLVADVQVKERIAGDLLLQRDAAVQRRDAALEGAGVSYSEYQVAKQRTGFASMDEAWEELDAAQRERRSLLDMADSIDAEYHRQSTANEEARGAAVTSALRSLGYSNDVEVKDVEGKDPKKPDFTEEAKKHRTIQEIYGTTNSYDGLPNPLDNDALESMRRRYEASGEEPPDSLRSLFAQSDEGAVPYVSYGKETEEIVRARFDDKRYDLGKAIDDALSKGYITPEEASEYKSRLAAIPDFGTRKKRDEEAKAEADRKKAKKEEAEAEAAEKRADYAKQLSNPEHLNPLARERAEEEAAARRAVQEERNARRAGGAASTKKKKTDVSDDSKETMETAKTPKQELKLKTYDSFADIPADEHALVNTKSYNEAARETDAEFKRVKSELESLEATRSDFAQQYKDLSDKMNRGESLNDEELARYDSVRAELRKLDTDLIPHKQAELREAKEKRAEANKELENVRAYNKASKEWLAAKQQEVDAIDEASHSSASFSSEIESDSDKTVVDVDVSSAQQEAEKLEQTYEEVAQTQSKVTGATPSPAPTQQVTTATEEYSNELTEASQKEDKVTGAKPDTSGTKKATEETKEYSQAALELVEKQKKINNIKWKMTDGNLSTDEYDKLKQSLHEAEVEFNNLKKAAGVTDDEIDAINNAFGASQEPVDQTIDSFKRFLQVARDIRSLDVKNMKLDRDIVDAEDIKKAESQLESLQQEYNELRNSLEGQLSGNQLSQVIAELDKTKAKISEVTNAIDLAKKKLVNKIEINYDLGDYEAKYHDIRAKALSLKGANTELDQSYDELSKSYREFVFAMSSGEATIDEKIAAEQRLQAALENTKNTYKTTQSMLKAENVSLASQKSLDAMEKLNSETEIFGLTMKNWLRKNSAAADDFGARIKELELRLESCDNAVDFSRIKNEFKQITLEAENAGKATMTFGHRLKEQANRYAAYFSIAELAMEAWQGLRYMYQAVLEVDSAMVGLYRVTDLTAQQYDKLYDNMIASAKEYGQTLTDTINATTDWIKAGFDETTSLGLAEATSVYQHISDLDYDTATENLLTAYKGFEKQLTSNAQIDFGQTFGDDTAGAVTYITDVLNELDNKFAVTSAGIGEALQRSASSMYVAGNTMEQTAALVSAAMEVTQDPEGAGSTMKILSMRLRGMKGELADLGEEVDENVENISKMQGQVLNLTHGKVNIFDDTGKFRSTYDIMKDIADVWEGLNSIEQADLIETIAGKHRANTVAALVQNFGHAEEMLTTALDASGSAAQENEKYLNSLQGRVDVMTASFQAFSNTVMSSDFLKGGISAITALVDALDRLIDMAGVLPTIAGVIGGALSFKGIGISSFDRKNQQWKWFGQTSGDFKNLIGSFASGGLDGVFMPKAMESWEDFNKKTVKNEECLKNFAAALRSTGDAGAAFDQSMAGADASTKKLARSLEFQHIVLSDTSDGFVNTSNAISKHSNEMRLNAAAAKAQDTSLKNVAEILADYKSGLQSTNGICKASGLHYEELARKTGEYNKVAGQVMSTTNVAKVGMGHYVGALVGATAKTVGLTVASMALNTVLTMGIGFVITAIVSGIIKLINAKEELAKKVDEVTASFEEQHSSLTSGKSDFESLATKYAKLSHGVNSLGENVGLTSAQYAEYQDVVNQIAQQIPSLVQGYDSQGNAILSVKGNVEALTRAYEDLMIANYNAILDEGDDVFKDFQNKVVENNDEGIIGNKTTYSAMKNVESLLGSDDLEKSLSELTNQELLDMAQAIENEAGLEVDWEGSIDSGTNAARARVALLEVLQSDFSTIRSAVNDFNNDLDEDIEGVADLALAHVGKAFSYKGNHADLDSGLKNIFNQMLSGLDYEFYEQFNTAEEMYDELDNMLDKFASLDIEQVGDIKEAFDLQTEYNNGDVSFGEYLKGIENAKDAISQLDEASQKQIYTTLGFEFDEESLEASYAQYEDLLDQLAKSDDDDETGVNKVADTEKFLAGLTNKEMEVALSIVNSSDSDYTLEELQKEIDKMMTISGENFTFDIDVEAERIEKVNEALQESVSLGGLSSESIEGIKAMYQDLDGYDPSKIFEKTAHGVRLNTDEVAKLEDQLIEAQKADLAEELIEVENAWKDVTEQLRTCNDEEERAVLLGQQAQLEGRIAEIEEATAAYEGLTNALLEWEQAASGGEEGDAYDSAKDLYADSLELKEQGLVGTNEFRKAAEFMTNEEAFKERFGHGFAEATVGELETVFNEGSKKMDRYFTDGSDGVNNMLNDLHDLNSEWAHLNDNGEWELDIPIEDAAKELGVSVALLEAVLGKGHDYGLEINYESVYDAAELLEEMYDEAESASAKLRDLGHTELTFSFKSTDEDDLDAQIEKAQEIVDKIREADLEDDGKINLSVEGAEEANLVLETLMLQKQEVTKPAFMNVSVATIGDEKLGLVIQAMQQIQTYKNLYEIQVAIGADTSSTETKIQEVIGKINQLKEENPQVFADLGLDTTEFNSALSTLDANITAGATLDPNALATLQTTLQGVDATVLAKVGLGDTSQVDTYTSTEKTANGTVNWGNDTTAVDAWILQSHTADGTVYWDDDTTNLKTTYTGTGYITWNAVPEVDGTAHVGGTAFANGTAFKRGYWGTKDSGTALVGELGEELLVRDGHFYTIGSDSAEFINYKKGDIIFNHEQTREILEKGKITHGNGRGRAFAGGTVFPSGKAFYENTATGGGVLHPSSPSSSSSSSSSSSGDSADEFKETIDWIEIAIDRIERAISKLDLKANSIFKKWSTRNNALAQEITKVREEIDLQQRAYDRYMQEAKSVGLSESWAKKVREGKVDIETITDENLKEKIDEYQQWYEKALDCADAVEELKEKEAELYMQRFENVAAEYENMLSIIEHEKNMLDEYINQSEARGWITSTKYYDALAENERESIAKLQEEKQALLSSMQEAMASGAIEKESEAWYEMVNQIDEVTLAIAEGETALLEYIKAIREIEWEVFDLLQGRISNLASEADFLIELLSSDKLHDDNGQLTDEGMSTMGLHGVNYNVYMAQADKYAKELLDINKELAKDPYNQELVDRRQELLDLQQESILAAEGEREAIRDLVEEGINLELDALQEKIDKHNEALEAQKDLYDYQKKIEESTKNIASLEKQMAAYEDDDSEETRHKVQQLKVELEEAKDDLEEQEYDRYISDQEQLLDDLYEEYETILNQRLDNIDALIVDMIEAINNNANTISSTLNENAESVGYDMTEYMGDIWDTSGNIKDVASVYGDDTATTVGEAIKKMDKDIADMVEYVDKQASANISYAASSSAAYAPEANKVSGSATNTKVDGITPSMIQSNKNETKKDTTIKKGDTINAGNAKIYADSEGNGGGKQYFASDPVYTVVGERGDYILVSHADGNSGATGWFKKSDVVKEYASGKRRLSRNEVAWTQEEGREFILRPSDGAILTPLAKGDSVLNAVASSNLWNMANNPIDFIKDSLGFGVADSVIGHSAQTTIEQNFENVSFVMPNVKNYEEMLMQMKNDKNFQRLIDAMGVDQIAGKTPLRKGKSIR